MNKWEVIEGDCLEVMAGMAAESVDSVVTDPPYELGFLGKSWDSTGIAYNVEVWRQCLRVLRPGGHLLAFGGARTYHRLACAIEDAGFEVRDQIMWVFGGGFPKSRNVGKAIDGLAGVNRKLAMEGTLPPGRSQQFLGKLRELGFGNVPTPPPETVQSQQWEGWGTALRPLHEPICVARKPLAEATVAANVLRHGTGAINVDGCRAGDEQIATRYGLRAGRWPGNFAHDGSAEVARLMPADAARFFYTPKANKDDRNEGCEGLPMGARQAMGSGCVGKPDQSVANNLNIHPTVKPHDLMRWLVRLVTRPGGLVLDPFNGSGSTGKAAMVEGMRYVGIEKESGYVETSRQRIAEAGNHLFAEVSEGN